jgi:hypothetical protein
MRVFFIDEYFIFLYKPRRDRSDIFSKTILKISLVVNDISFAIISALIPLLQDYSFVFIK